jgi:TQXA domain-containing protein/LPXTG-motif cell wall-anchored protein
MTMAQRAASRRGVAAVVASLALAAGLVGTFAAPSSADDGDSGEFQGVSELHLTVKGHLPGGGTVSVKAGLLNLQVEGSEDVDLAYCVDFIGGIEEGDVLPAAPWDSSSIANREAVERILNSYFPTGVGPAGHEITGTDSEKAAGTQAAIWHFTNGFVLEGSTGHPAVLANYEAILAAVAADALPALSGPVVVNIGGETDVDAIPGQLIGPFVIHTTAASVELTPGEGTTLHHADGSPFEGPGHDGDEIWLKASEAGEASLYAYGEGLAAGVRLFADRYKQDMAFLVVTPTMDMDEVEVEVHTPPTTSSSTTSTSTTSTTEQSTTTSSVVPQSTVTTPTTTPVTPQQGGGLPRTGAPTLALVALALVLLAAGVGFGVVSRRRREANEAT